MIKGEEEVNADKIEGLNLENRKFSGKEPVASRTAPVGYEFDLFANRSRG
jgi:hypothetical protein